VFSTNGNWYNDGIGGEDNFTKTGFPNADSDIYGNRVEQAWDDGIEAEGGNRNVRIWGNYMNQTLTGVATTANSVGPSYIFRNVFNRANSSDNVFAKSGSISSVGDGRRYLFHNTLLQNGSGSGFAVGGTGSTQMVANTVSRNNIFQTRNSSSTATYQVGSGN